MEKTQVLRKPRVFYGYWIVFIAFLLMLINSGCGYYAFSLYVKSFQTDFGWSRGEIMLAISIFFLVSGAMSPFVGRLIERFGVKKVISIGAFMAGLGFVLLSQLHNLSLLYIGWAVYGVGGAATGQVPTTIIVSNWFKKRRGTAIGIMAMGIGGGGFVLAPIIGGYLIPHFGWRASYSFLTENG